MSPLDCIIIEDQIPAQNTLIDFIDQTPNLKVLGTYISPLEAIETIENGLVDILFLDIHLPKLSGIELLRTLKFTPQTIITTAFSKYALDGYDLDVVDYLMKPFSFERFLKAVSKIKKEKDLIKTEFKQSSIFIRTKGQIRKVELSAIEFIQAKGDFVVISTGTSREIASLSLQKILELLGDGFIRCHKSFVININFIDKIIGNHIIVKNTQIPIGRTYKEKLLEKIRLV